MLVNARVGVVDQCVGVLYQRVGGLDHREAPKHIWVSNLVEYRLYSDSIHLILLRLILWVSITSVSNT